MRPIEPRQYLSRSTLLRRGGAALVASSGLAAWLAGEAAAAAPDNDLAYLRLLIGVELLAADFQDQALGAGSSREPRRPRSRRCRPTRRLTTQGSRSWSRSRPDPGHRRRHRLRVPEGRVRVPEDNPATRRTIESLSLGAYIGAVENVQTPQLRLPIGQIAANEAQHGSALAHARAAGDRPRLCAVPLDRRRLGRARPIRELNAEESYTASEAAAALGISLDTLRRWDKAGRVKVERDERTAASSPSPRSIGCGATRRARTSARATASGRRDRREDRRADGPGRDRRQRAGRLVAVVTRDAVEELGLKAGHGGDRDRQVDQRDDPELEEDGAKP